MNPPMEPPPFEQPMIRKCIKTKVRIQSHEDLQEVLILTTVLCSVDSQLNRDTSAESYYLRPQDDADGDMSSSEEDMYSDSSQDCSEDDSVSSSGRAAPQSQDEKRHKMKAFWLRKDPIAEVWL